MMTKKHIHFLRSAAVVVLLAGLLPLPIAHGEMEDQMGITVSSTPEPGWTPDSDRPAKTSPQAPLGMIIGGVAALLLIAGGFLIVRKAGKKQGKPQEKEPVDKVSRPAKPVEIPPVAVAKQPGPALRTEPMKKPLPDPVVRRVAAESPAPPSKAPTVVAESPRIPVQPPQPPAPAPEPVKTPAPKAPEPVPEPVKAPAPKAPEPAAPPAEDDLLFKHLDLLKRLKNKENT